MVLVEVDLVEDRLKSLDGEELLLVDAGHHELLVRDVTTSIAVSHHDEVLDLLLIKLVTVVLPVTGHKLILVQESSLLSIQVIEHLLKLNCLTHLQEVLDQETKSSLLYFVLA